MLKRLSLILVAAAFAPSAARASGGKCPNVVIVLDKSGSMAEYGAATDSCINQCPPSEGGSCKCGYCETNNDCNAGETCTGLTQTTYGWCTNSKMPIAQQVIHDVLLGSGAIAAPSPLVRFGFTYFPSSTSGQACSPSTSTLRVDCDFGTTQSIVDQVNAITPDGNTPTGASLNGIRTAAALTDDRPRYVILVTDGEPTCSDTRQTSVAAVQNLAGQGVTTFVVGFGSGTTNSTTTATLNQMAAAGATYPDGGAYSAFSATDATTLAQVLGEIIQTASSGELGGSASCDPCLDITCGAGLKCDSTSGQCVTDPYAACAGGPCGVGQYCRVDASGNAVCAAPCSTLCPSGQLCGIDGTCQTDPCADGSCGTCPAGQVHDGEGAACVPSQCGSGQIACPAGTFCSATSNTCSPLFSGTTGTSGTSGSTGTSGDGTSGSSGTTGKKTNGNVTSDGCASGAGGIALCAFAALGLALSLRRRG
jgi:hypothetical protein